jgi:hypothetical protein
MDGYAVGERCSRRGYTVFEAVAEDGQAACPGIAIK